MVVGTTVVIVDVVKYELVDVDPPSVCVVVTG